MHVHTQLVRPYVYIYMIYRLIDVYTHTCNKYILVGLRLSLRFQYKFTSHKLKQAYA